MPEGQASVCLGDGQRADEVDSDHPSELLQWLGGQASMVCNAGIVHQACQLVASQRLSHLHCSTHPGVVEEALRALHTGLNDEVTLRESQDSNLPVLLQWRWQLRL